jgi:MFS family permease
LRAVLQGFASGLHHVLSRPTVGLAILVVMIVRFCFGMCILIVLLLFQKYFTESTWIFRTGASGIAEVLAIGAIGVFAGAVVTAPVVRKIGRTRYLVILLTSTAVIGVAVGAQFTIWSTMVVTFIVGFAYQSSKVCMDSVVQADSDDAYVGRVFALYDTANNLCYVAAFGLGVLLVPANGTGTGAVFLIGALFMIAGIGYGVAMARLRRGPARAGETHLLASSDETPVADPADGSPAAADGSPAQADRSQHS